MIRVFRKVIDTEGYSVAVGFWEAYGFVNLIKNPHGCQTNIYITLVIEMIVIVKHPLSFPSDMSWILFLEAEYFQDKFTI